MSGIDYSSTDFFSDNPPAGSYDPFPDTSLGGEFFGPSAPTQEQLGQQIILDTQRGLAQEQLGREIVEASLIDQYFFKQDNTQPWYKGIDGSLAGTAKLLSAVPGLYKTSDAGFKAPTNTTWDGKAGTMNGGTITKTATATGTLDLGGLDFLYLGLGLVGAFVAYKVVKALA